MRVLPVVALVIAVLGASCGDDKSPSSPTPAVPNVAGNWAGPSSDNSSGPGRIALSVAQSGSALSGTWASTFNTGYNNGGALSGSINVNGSMTVTLTPSVPTSCPFNATANVSGNQASGTYAAFNCSSAVTGTFTLTRQ